LLFQGRRGEGWREREGREVEGRRGRAEQKVATEIC